MLPHVVALKINEFRQMFNEKYLLKVVAFRLMAAFQLHLNAAVCCS